MDHRRSFTIDFQLLIDFLLLANRRAADYLNYLSNEPSVGIHHVNSHVHRSVHKMVQIKVSQQFRKIFLDRI